MSASHSPTSSVTDAKSDVELKVFMKRYPRPILEFNGNKYANFKFLGKPIVKSEQSQAPQLKCGM